MLIRLIKYTTIGISSILGLLTGFCFIIDQPCKHWDDTFRSQPFYQNNLAVQVASLGNFILIHKILRSIDHIFFGTIKAISTIFAKEKLFFGIFFMMFVMTLLWICHQCKYGSAPKQAKKTKKISSIVLVIRSQFAKRPVQLINQNISNENVLTLGVSDIENINNKKNFRTYLCYNMTHNSRTKPLFCLENE